MPSSLADWFSIVWAAFIVSVLVAVTVFIFLQLRRKRYIFFRVVEVKNATPGAHLQVYGVRPRNRGKKHIGNTDSKGEFKMMVSAFAYPLLWIEGKGIALGALPTDSVSHPQSFQQNPAICRIEHGYLQPPDV